MELLVLADQLAEQKRERERQEEALKHAFIASGADPEAVYPTDLTDLDPADDGDVDFDYSAVQWAEPSEDEWARMQAALQDRQVMVSSTPDGTEDIPPPILDDGFDREWT